MFIPAHETRCFTRSSTFQKFIVRGIVSYHRGMGSGFVEGKMGIGIAYIHLALRNPDLFLVAEVKRKGEAWLLTLRNQAPVIRSYSG